MTKIKSTSAAVVALLLGTIKADQPVHCLQKDITGDWTFHVTKQAELVNLF